ncbi:hypothetical protein BV898_07581 [Hypsibius exemplaris]|uniref:RanBP2-type domain-containing protein n=1 Tax=Hypsibius exemplaris TaxID=2072580 RepID=A0A1W0WT51_HYPEX|nr:hypothetical protein BV898_07581 [Hypsibius exemplaris]
MSLLENRRTQISPTHNYTRYITYIIDLFIVGRKIVQLQMSLRSDTARLQKEKSSKRKRHFEDDEWDCIHCTFKNEPANGKCEVCDIPRGTSTRRGGYNPQLNRQQQELEQMLASDRAKQKRVKARNVRDVSVSSLPSDASTPLPNDARSPSPHLTDTSSMPSPPPPTHRRRNAAPAKARTTKSPSVSISRVSESSSSYDFSEIDPSPSSSMRTTPSPRKFGNDSKMSKTSESFASTSTTPEKIGKRLRGRPKGAAETGGGDSSLLSGAETESAASVSSRQRGRSRFFTVAHDGVTLEFEEIIPSDVSDFEDDEVDGEDSDDGSNSDES